MKYPANRPGRQGHGQRPKGLTRASFNHHFFLSCLSVYFSWRQEKYQKNRALRLGLRLPSRKRVFRRGQELIPLRGIQTACPLFPENPLALGCAATGESPFIGVRSTIKQWALMEKPARNSFQSRTVARNDERVRRADLSGVKLR
ncbi:hypothetical protein [Desulfosudis oleivorans]|uniref:hypothetical protein n=1 Tax=Desulfosudis oleivorans TaxID=181663 RepID=UPI00059E6E81|nr:hypothetical protein [Desulfosudis oleivorans]